ncbi:collagen-binding domain-containing protein [Iodobacter fluviatilis]|uniref:PEP-CTERM sorting domain-containing protein n=1 Tax=Iodobacter fluviatilis TaxID=537 RepID=A0A7G3G9F9_9NEIS|nr:collagen-binding domain-containing protein [Iodobacter fluviatilis]QBC43987.1 PEP-CTERM sorting domain-containing protein [Iodobacter fluviatilis]
MHLFFQMFVFYFIGLTQLKRQCWHGFAIIHTVYTKTEGVMMIFRFTLIAAGILAFTQPASAALSNLGIANDYSGFFFSNVNGGNDVEGKLAVGGNLTAATLNTIGFRNAHGTKGPSLVVAGNMVDKQLDIYNGPVKKTDTNKSYGPDVKQELGALNAGYGVVGGKIVKNKGWADLKTDISVKSVVDFDKAKKELSALSNGLANSKTNGQVIHENGGFTLKGDNKSLQQVFNLKATEFLNLNLTNIKKDATVIINYTGSFSDIVLAGGQLGQMEAMRSNILFNLPNAKKLSVNTFVWGSILAPQAAIYGTAHVEGSVIAHSLESNLELGYEPFKGNLTSPVPEPETYALMGMGLIGLVLRRRSKK